MGQSLMILDWLKSLFNGSVDQPANDTGTKGSVQDQQAADDDSRTDTNRRDPDDPVYKQTYDALQTYWQGIGQVEPDVLTYVVNPMFMGAPAWPGTRQAFKVIRTDSSLIIASDGLSDPFDQPGDEDENGFGMEVFIEVKGLQDMPFGEIQSSGAFALIEQAARQVAYWGGITQALDKYTIMSSEIPLSAETMQAGWLTPDEGVGVLFGMAAAGRPVGGAQHPPVSRPHGPPYHAAP